jgi:hypothetical protein
MCVIILPQNTALTKFPSNTPENDKLSQTCEEDPKVGRPRLDNHALDKTTRYSKAWLVKTAQDVTIAPRFRQVVTAMLDFEERNVIISRDVWRVPIDLDTKTYKDAIVTVRSDLTTVVQ